METKTTSYCCPLTNQCAFFQRSKTYMPRLSNQLKQEYCFCDNTHCARLLIQNKIGAEWVPLSMLPHQHQWGQQIMDEVNREPVEELLQTLAAAFIE